MKSYTAESSSAIEDNTVESTNADKFSTKRSVNQQHQLSSQSEDSEQGRIRKFDKKLW